MSLASAIETLKLLESQKCHYKSSSCDSLCAHVLLEYRELKFLCADCSKEISETEFPNLFQQETDRIHELGNSDKSDEKDTMNRGVTIEFLVAFCNAFDLWDVSVSEARRNIVIPITCEERCRFVDLPILKGVVGRAETYVVYAVKSKFGDLISAISEGADPKRRVWLDIFACRQWPSSKTDSYFEYTIHHCPSTLVFCPDPPELLNCSDISALSDTVKEQIPFCRMWCQSEIYFASMSDKVSIVVKCGHYSSAESKFIESKDTLTVLANIIDVKKVSNIKFAIDKKALERKKVVEKDVEQVTAKLRGVLRVAEATCGDSILHNAACGDENSKVRILDKPEDYIHKIAIAGYLHLLKTIIRQPKYTYLIRSMEPITGRIPLINAVWGGSYKCLKYLVQKGAPFDWKDNYDKTALDYAQEFKNYLCGVYLRELLSKNALPSFYIKYTDTDLLVGPNDESNLQLILHGIDSKTRKQNHAENKSPFLFRFVDDQLQHVQSGKYAHPINGRKGSGVSIGLSDGSDGERTSCFPFDFDPTHCLLAGGDNYFVKVNHNDELVWHNFCDSTGENNPFDSENGFLIMAKSIADFQQPTAIVKSVNAPSLLNYSQECENAQMSGKIHEFLFPRSYLIDYVEERPPYNGKIKDLFKGGICDGDKTIASDSITQRMLLITSNIKTIEFSFGKNPWMAKLGSDFDFTQLLSFRLNELLVVSNVAEIDKKLSFQLNDTDRQQDKIYQKLSVTMNENYPFFSSIRVQCVLSLQKNANNVKHICFLEVTALKSTATLNGNPLPYDNGVWSIGKRLCPTEKDTKLGDGELYVFDVEEVKGPLVFTGVGVDSFAGFVFQIARIDESKSIQYLIGECFYEEVPRLKAADITHYHYFESGRKDQTGYKDSGHTTYTVKNTFRELALEDKDVAILVQKLNHFDSEFITNPVSEILPFMLDILERCFADNQSLIQSIIRVSHIKSDKSMIDPTVRQIWSTFADTISLVKNHVLRRPNLNMIECALLSEKGNWDRFIAIFVAISQCFISFVLARHIFFTELDESCADCAQCDVQSIVSDIGLQFSLNVMLDCGYFIVDFSFLMTIIAVGLTFIKMWKQIQDQYNFYVVFKQMINKKNWPPTIVIFPLDIVLLLLDVFVNVILSSLLVLFTFFLISSSEKVVDLVLNCLAITFIVELDENLNHRDSEEVKDLVIQSFKSYLIRDMMRVEEDITAQHIYNRIGCRDKSIVDRAFLLEQLDSADYSSDPDILQSNLMVLQIVQYHIMEEKILPVLNNIFYGDPDRGKPKFLALRFKKDVTVTVREGRVVDFVVVEKMLRKRDGSDNKHCSTKSDSIRNVITSILKVCFNIFEVWAFPVFAVYLAVLVLKWNWYWIPIIVVFLVLLLRLCESSWIFMIFLSLLLVSLCLSVLERTVAPKIDLLLTKNEWQADLSGSVVSLTWPHSGDLLSRSEVEAQIVLHPFLSQGNHSSAVDRIVLSVSGQKNILKLMAEFGFMSFVAGSNGTLTHYDGFRNDRMEDICAGVEILLSNKFWFDYVSDSVTEPFRFAGGCILPPNQLVIKYVSALSPQNQRNEEKEEEGALKMPRWACRGVRFLFKLAGKSQAVTCRGK